MSALHTAQRVIRRYGRTMTLAKRSRTPLDALNPHRGPVLTETETEVTAAFVDGGNWGYSADELGDMTRKGQKVALVAGPTEGLETYDRLVDGSSTYEIRSVKTLKPGDTVLLYQFVVGGAA